MVPAVNATLLRALTLLLGSGKTPNEGVKLSYGSSEPLSNSSPCDIPEGCHACYDPCALDPPEPCRRDPLAGIPTDDDSLAILASLDWPRRDLQWFLEAFKAANNNFEFVEQTTTTSPFINLSVGRSKRKGVEKVDPRQKQSVSAAVFEGPIVITVNCGTVSEEQIVDVEDFANEFRLDLVLSLLKKDTSKIQLEAIQRGVETLTQKETLEQSLREQNVTFGNNSATLKHQLAFRKTDIISTRLAKVGTVINAAVSGFGEMTGLPGISSVGLIFLGDLPTCKNRFSSFLRPRLAVCNPNDPYRTLDGSCNNVDNDLWGAAFTAFRRDLAPSYDDGVSTFRLSVLGNGLPSARLISNSMNNVRSKPSKSYSILHVTYGQFIDHDLTSTPLSRASFFGYPVSESPIRCCFEGFETPFGLHPECAPIKIPFNDPLYSCFHQECMEFVRSAPASGDCQMGPREQTNQHSSYLDGSVIYGVKPEETDDLRTFVDGLLKIQLSKDGQVLLPKDSASGGQCNTPERMQIGEFCFRAGDGRVNEQILLTFFQTVWAREHNRVAKILKRSNVDWNDEKLFQETRRIVGAQLQQITYSEFLPSLIGPTLMATSKLNPLEGDQQTTDYVEFINAAIANNFATAAYRFGHSLIADNVLFVTKYGKTTPKELSTMFFNPFDLYKKDGMCDVARGGLNLPQNAMDPHFTPEVAGKLFRGTSPFGLDLLSLNIQRGRDHGLPPYNRWRVLCGLPRANSFDELKDQMTEARIMALAQVYDHVDDIDLYVGGVSENPIPGALLGHTFTCLVHNQFYRMKYGDRYWFEYKDGPGAFTKAQIKQLHRVTLARVMCNNLPELAYIQRWPLKTPGPDNPKVCCKSIRQYNLDPWNPDFVEVEEEVEEKKCCDDQYGDDCCENENQRK